MPSISHMTSSAVIYVRNNTMKCFAFIVSASGAALVASTDLAVQMTGFEFWVISNICWLIMGIKDEDWFLFATFATYFFFNLWGIANRYGWC